MSTTMAKLSGGGLLAVATLAIGGILGARYIGTRKISASERLCDALLDTGTLRDVARDVKGQSEARLAACAGYFVDVCRNATEGWGMGTGANDPVGHTRYKTHPYTQGIASVLTEAHVPEHVLNYSVSVPDVATVRGVRKHGTLTLNGILPAYAIPDTTQIGLGDGYTAQIESDLRVSEGLVTGAAKLMGTVTLKDSAGNIGRLNIGADGVVHGTIMREARIVGRMDGKLGTAITFKPFQLEHGEK